MFPVHFTRIFRFIVGLLLNITIRERFNFPITRFIDRCIAFKHVAYYYYTNIYIQMIYDERGEEKGSVSIFATVTWRVGLQNQLRLC